MLSLHLGSYSYGAAVVFSTSVFGPSDLAVTSVVLKQSYTYCNDWNRVTSCTTLEQVCTPFVRCHGAGFDISCTSGQVFTSFVHWSRLLQHVHIGTDFNPMCTSEQVFTPFLHWSGFLHHVYIGAYVYIICALGQKIAMRDIAWNAMDLWHVSGSNILIYV